MPEWSVATDETIGVVGRTGSLERRTMQYRAKTVQSSGKLCGMFHFYVVSYSLLFE